MRPRTTGTYGIGRISSTRGRLIFRRWFRPIWYHFGMAMTLRLPAELEQELDALAVEEGVSKHSLITEGARELIERRRRRAVIGRAIDHVDTKYGDVIDRLAHT